MSELVQKMRILSERRALTLNCLVAPARAALNQMQDAGMKRGAEPLAEALFQLDAVDSEMKSVIEADPVAFIDSLKEMMSGGQ